MGPQIPDCFALPNANQHGERREVRDGVDTNIRYYATGLIMKLSIYEAPGRREREHRSHLMDGRFRDWSAVTSAVNVPR
jgi:hypothetical protein